MPIEESNKHASLLSVDLSHSLRAFEAAQNGKRSKKEFAQLNRWFEIALNNMGRGLSMFDADQRLIVCNKRYRDIFSLPESLTQPGTPFAESCATTYATKVEATGRRNWPASAGGSPRTWPRWRSANRSPAHGN
jgi:PAS domain-containing protein